MERQELREKFRIDIRRKQITQRMQAMRSKIHTDSGVNYQLYLPIIQQINKGTKKVEDCLKELKVLSFCVEGAQKIVQFGVHILLYTYLNDHGSELTVVTYNDILTTFINLIVHLDIEIPVVIMKTVIQSILIPERQMISLWLIANLIHQQTDYSKLVAQELVDNCQVIEFMVHRIKSKFENEGDIVIFCYFCSSFLTVSGSFQATEVKSIYEVLEETLYFKNIEEENFWFISQALIQHGKYIGANEYELFGTNLLKRFDDYCKNKKTKFVKNYLKMLVKFTTVDALAYEKLLKYEVFKNLDYCIINRFPEVKKLCADIGFNLLDRFYEKVDIQNIDFFPQLVLQIVNLEKYPIDCQISIVRYANKFLQISVGSKVTKQSKQKFIDDLLLGSTISVLANVLMNCQNNPELISEILFLFSIFLKIDENGKVYSKCLSQKVPDFLMQINTQNQRLYTQIHQFLQSLKK